MSTTPSTPEQDLMHLVRSADPLGGGVDPIPAEAAETLLQDILAAPRGERSRPSRPSRTAVVRVAAVGAVAAVALGAAAALTGEEGGGVTPASAAVVRHAIAALDQPSGTILHVDMSGTQTNGDGTTASWRDQSWQENDAPYDRRQVETTPGGTAVESGNVGDSEQVYDSATNTIYTSSPTSSSKAAQRRYELSAGPRAGTYLLRPTMFRVSANGGFTVTHGRLGSVVITARQARALKDGTEVVSWRRSASRSGTVNGFKLAVVPRASTTPTDSADPASPDFRNQILALLQSGGAYVVGHATVEGHDTLEIRSQDGHTTYYVDPNSYSPVELDTTGTGGGVELRFDTWELLPTDHANEALLSLTDQHPSATVDRNPADYTAAEQRLLPNG